MCFCFLGFEFLNQLLVFEGNWEFYQLARRVFEIVVLMSREQKRGKQEKGSDSAEKVVVAVKASKEIPKTALVWALTHVVQLGDFITLLVVVPSQSLSMCTLLYCRQIRALLILCNLMCHMSCFASFCSFYF